MCSYIPGTRAQKLFEYTEIYILMYIQTYIYGNFPVYIYIYIYIYAHTHT